MTVKEFMKMHEGEYIHLHWEGFDKKLKCLELDAYSTNQNLAETHGELEILSWEEKTEWHYDNDWNYTPMRVTFVTLKNI